jgi:hypothetical protein
LFLQAQQQQLERAEGAFQRSAGRLREMQQHLAAQGGGEAGDAADGARVLEVLQDDVARLRVQVRSCRCYYDTVYLGFGYGRRV